MTKTKTTKWGVKNWTINAEQCAAVIAFEATIMRNGTEVIFAQRDGGTGRLSLECTDRAPAQTLADFESFITKTMGALLENPAAAWITMTATKQRSRTVFIKDWAGVEARTTALRPTADHYEVVVRTTKGHRIRATSQTTFSSEQLARIVADETRKHYEVAGWNKRFSDVLVYRGPWSHDDAKPVATFKIGRTTTKRFESSCTVALQSPASVVFLNDIIQDVLKASDSNADPMHVALGCWIDRVATFDLNGGRVSMTINEWTAPMVQLLELELRTWLKDHTAKSFSSISRQFIKAANTLADALRCIPSTLRKSCNVVFHAKRRDEFGRRALRWLDAVHAQDVADELGSTSVVTKTNFHWSDAKLAAFKEQLRREELERDKCKTRKGRRRAKRATKRSVVVDPTAVGEKVAELIKALATMKDKGEKRKLRGQLRRLGHSGGLRTMKVEE